LVATAHAPDGLVEGLESSDDAFVFGVQWHPEDLTHADWHMRRLFAGLLDAARDWRGARPFPGGAASRLS
jgi:putative glutamine amidotransferase